MKAIRTVLACIRKADATYNLIQHGDKIVVGLSGGKDSICLLYALNLYQKFSHTDFKIQPVTLDLGFPNFDPKILENFCSSLGYKLIISDNKEVFQILKIQKEIQKTKHLPCSICSRMKKAAINKIANEINFNKVAFAHHGDDAIETLFMNEFHGGRIATFSPKMHLDNTNIDFIRPLCLVREKDIIKLIKEENLPIISSNCPADKNTTREVVKDLLNDIYTIFPQARESLLNMISNYKQMDIWDNHLDYQINQNGLSICPIIDGKTMKKAMMLLLKETDKSFKKILNNNYFIYLIFLKKKEIGLIAIDKKDKEFTISFMFMLKKERNKGYMSEALEFLSQKIIGEFFPCNIIIRVRKSYQNHYVKLGFINNKKDDNKSSLVYLSRNK